MHVPDAAVEWLVAHCSSNAELACFSNVSRKWREIVTRAVLRRVRSSWDAPGNEGGLDLLLLPSMARCLVSQENTTDASLESFCLIWLHPSGIQFKRVPIDAMDDSDSEDRGVSAKGSTGDDSVQVFAPSGEQSYAGSEDEIKSSRRQLSRSSTPTASSITARLQRLDDNKKYANCLYQWNGYSEAVDVLAPFGYSVAFVNNLLALAVPPAKTQLDDEAIREEVLPRQMDFGKYSTYAVRGATLARPEGYCLCWDHDEPVIEAQIAGSRNKELRLSDRQQERDMLLKRRMVRRKELQRETLPKVLNGAQQSSSGLGVNQPCVQFLNVDSSHAVRLFTPPFTPKPVSAPITVFCIGIATEDGCFISGLRRRFEMGHLYPETPQDDLIERSPICLCTDNGEQKGHNQCDENSSDNHDEEENDGSFNSDDSSCDMSLEATGTDARLNCACPFSGLGDAGQQEEDDRSRNEICRGKLGPGVWHCYTAIFDGVESRIRIDCVPETTRCSFPSCGDRAFLDGLTIGADHTFDMSLCFGQGSDGEGEGAIAELAVFKGRLDLQDIQTIEHYLMNKFGISGESPDHDMLLEENRYSRMAHAMLSHPPHHKLFSKSSQRVPLRYMTKHRTVAWRQKNPVTGDAIRVQRIGSRFEESSSEW